jgi:hypothetical protein
MYMIGAVATFLYHARVAARLIACASATPHDLSRTPVSTLLSALRPNTTGSSDRTRAVAAFS